MLLNVFRGFVLRNLKFPNVKKIYIFYESTVSKSISPNLIMLLQQKEVIVSHVLPL